MFFRRILSTVDLDSANFDFNNYNFDFLAFTYGLVPPVDGSFSFSIGLNIFFFDPEDEEAYSEAAIDLNTPFDIYFVASTTEPSLNNEIHLNISLYSNIKSSSVLSVNVPAPIVLDLKLDFSFTAILGIDGTLNIPLKIQSYIFVNTIFVGGTFDLKLKFNIHFVETSINSILSLFIKPYLNILAFKTIYGIINGLVPLYSDFSSVTFGRPFKNQLLINIINGCVSEISFSGAITNYDSDVLLFNNEGIHKAVDGTQITSFVIDIENLEYRQQGRWTDVYMVGDLEGELFINDYECELKSSLRGFERRYKLPLGIMDRKINLYFEGNINYMDLFRIEKIKERTR